MSPEARGTADVGLLMEGLCPLLSKKEGTDSESTDSCNNLVQKPTHVFYYQKSQDWSILSLLKAD